MRLDRITRFLLVGSLLWATGAQWVVLQSFAWTKMAVQRSKTQGISSAMTSTLDGRHPCKLCVRIQKGAQTQKKQEAHFSNPKLELFYQTSQKPSHVLSPLWVLAVVPDLSHSLNLALDPPPPRQLCA